MQQINNKQKNLEQVHFVEGLAVVNPNPSTSEETDRVLKLLKTLNAPGLDGIPNKVPGNMKEDNEQLLQ
eukprot:snap_masked-scaffold_9-processed-gene-2.47-mRNA-1 protein AED:1.00 eAED:1.00 QI:0/-1/0/0/-1/1/1/0/68